MDIRHAKLISAMTEYDAGDTARIQHFIKVHDFAAAIGASENIDKETLFILETAAILHDIGIHVSEKKYGDCSGKHQELEGPPEARKLMEKLGGYTPEQTERVCFLIAHHHTYENVQGIDWQILLEADFLVNAFEDHLSENAVKTFESNVFKTATGKHLLHTMFAL